MRSRRSHCDNTDVNPSKSKQHKVPPSEIESNGEKPFECNICNEKYARVNDLKKHMRIHTGEKPYECDKCDEKFSDEGHFSEHERIHDEEKSDESKMNLQIGNVDNFSKNINLESGIENENIQQPSDVKEGISNSVKPFLCNQCCSGFTTRAHLKRHQTVHSGEKPYACRRCGKKFAHRDYLFNHEKSHKNDDKHRALEKFLGTLCNRCDERFSSPAALKMHKRIHSGDKPYVCGECGVKFSHSDAFCEHRRSHNLPKVFPCKYCVKVYSYEPGLSVHMKTHTGKLLCCKNCGRKFGTNSRLNSHMRTHAGEKPFECNICNTKFAYRNQMKEHMRIHTGGKPYECDKCDEKFSDEGHFSEHERMHDEEKTIENKMNLHIGNVDNLLKNMKLESGIENENIQEYSDAKEDISNSVKPFSCNQCCSIFTTRAHLKRHQTVHSGESHMYVGDVVKNLHIVIIYSIMKNLIKMMTDIVR